MQSPLFAFNPKSTQAQSGSTWLGSIYGLNWTKLRTYAKLEIELFWYLNSVLMLNWIGWNKTVYTYKNGFGII